MSITQAYEILRNRGTVYIYEEHLRRLRGGTDEITSLRRALEEILENEEKN